MFTGPQQYSGNVNQNQVTISLCFGHDQTPHIGEDNQLLEVNFRRWQQEKSLRFSASNVISYNLINSIKVRF